VTSGWPAPGTACSRTGDREPGAELGMVTASIPVRSAGPDGLAEPFADGRGERGRRDRRLDRGLLVLLHLRLARPAVRLAPGDLHLRAGNRVGGVEHGQGKQFAVRVDVSGVAGDAGEGPRRAADLVELVPRVVGDRELD